MKSEVEIKIEMSADQAIKAMDKVTYAAKNLHQAIQNLNETGIEIHIERVNKSKRWYQFWK
jgi:hydroxypyruvate isomerase